ncbi:TolC family protein [Flammeovirga aprica]|uniref:TolC family protein n=1 Tax=Flammeovirga aprica JL-4 TaxID=694437 RepID=A0A7X9S168_9BACT|nr:TolC family protein [Flammeovirga aprica]NME72426.1 TolC family protein [Flammeovirga aprica JL-4]
MKHFALLILFSLKGFYSYSQVNTLSLEEAIHYTLDQNFEIKIERMNLQDAEQQNTWGNAGRYPQVQLQSSNNLQYQYSSPASPFALEGKSSNNSINLGLSGQWVLYNGFNVSIRKEQFEKLEERARWQLLYEMEEQIDQVVQSYYMVQYENEKLKVLERILKLSRDKLETTELHNKVGAGSQFELARDQTTFYTDSTNYIDQKLVCENAQRDLNFLMGIEAIDQQYQLTDPLSITPIHFNYEELYDKMNTYNSSLQAQKINVYLQENNYQQNKNLKSITLMADMSYSGNTNWYTADMPQLEGGFKEETNRGFGYGQTIGLTLSVPIYNGGKNNRQIQSAIIKKEQAQIEMDRVELYLKKEFTKSYKEYQNAIRKVELSKESLNAAEKNLVLSQKQLEQGTITTFEFRQVQNSFLNSSLNLFNAQFVLIQSHVALLRVSGQLISNFQ